jgi:hypothetical protein
LNNYLVGKTIKQEAQKYSWFKIAITVLQNSFTTLKRIYNNKIYKFQICLQKIIEILKKKEDFYNYITDYEK